MKTMRQLGLAALAFAAVFATADQVRAQAPGTNKTNYAQTDFNGGVGISVSFLGNAKNTSAGSFTTNLYAVGSNPNNDSVGAYIGSTKTFCVDLFNFTGGIEEVNLGYTNGVVDKSIIGDTLDRNIGAAAYIMYQASLGSSGAFASAIAAASGVNLDAAVQVAIWEVAFDGINDTSTGQKVAGGAGLAAGSNQGVFYVTSLDTGVLNLAKAILDVAKTGTAYATTTALLFNFGPPDITPPAGGDYRQDQVTFAVPEPTTLLSGALALGLLAGLRLRRRKQA